MELKYRLLDHPFYQSWTAGEVSREQLAKYAASYADFIEQMPLYWDKVIKGFNIESERADMVTAEETSHIALWEEWSSELNKAEDYPKMTELLAEFQAMNSSELLGAIHAFEIQQPEVAMTKKQGLTEHYGFSANNLKYFDEHEDEREHIEFGRMIADEYADKEDFQSGFDRGSELIYKSLDLFMEC